MHYLHKILVHIPSAITSDENTTREEILEAVKRHARTETESFGDQAFDWREDESAGRWSDQYPQQAYLASEDLDWFVKELEEILRFQEGEIANSLIRLGESVGTDLPTIVQGLWDRDDHDPNPDPNKKFSSMTAYYLRTMAELLYGQYRCDSYFYNTDSYTARLFKSDMDTIKQNPEKWALVMFDYHN